MDPKVSNSYEHLLKDYLLIYRDALPSNDKKSIHGLTKRFDSPHTKESFTKLVLQTQAIVELSKRIVWFCQGALKLSASSAVCSQTLVRSGYETLLDGFFIFLDPLPPETLQLDSNVEGDFFPLLPSSPITRAYRFLRFSNYEGLRAAIDNFYYLRKTLKSGIEEFLIKCLEEIPLAYIKFKEDIEYFMSPKNLKKLKAKISELEYLIKNKKHYSTTLYLSCAEAIIDDLHAITKNPPTWRDISNLEEIVKEVSSYFKSLNSSDHTLISLWMDHGTLYKQTSRLAVHSSMWGLSYGTELEMDDKLDSKHNKEITLRVLKLLRVLMRESRIILEDTDIKLIDLEARLSDEFGLLF